MSGREDGGRVKQGASAVGASAAGNGDNVGDIASRGCGATDNLHAEIIALGKGSWGSESERRERGSDERLEAHGGRLTERSLFGVSD